MRITDRGLWRGGTDRLAVAVADEFDSGEEQGEEAGGEASHRQHESKPAEVRVWALTRDAAKADEDERGGDDSGAEDKEAGTKELAGVWLHKIGRKAKVLAVGSEHRVDHD